MPPLAQLVELQEPAIRAAANAGVPYILPSEFGPDPFAVQLVEENELLIAKKRIRDLIESIGVSSWISIAVGPWLDAGLNQGLWGIEPKTRNATIWRGADAKINTATISHTAEAVAAVLSLPEAELAKYKNKAVYTPSFTRDVNEVAREYEDKISQGDGVAPFVKFFITHFLEGHGGDFNHKVHSTELEKLEQLGLHKEDLVQAIRVALQ
ncbi:hypothetical protein FOC4_g10000696 [Fusarium odoratissimum]|uniref:Uncharacterized protein n=1 Tax=Fusarium oxysporum f. sp. cubense (strain race 4) TaxID=2502994 RepID=N1RMP1_FUSC4|nr:hypothetical protein FOC4_g10000696 [Fusarium odoratissimum]